MVLNGCFEAMVAPPGICRALKEIDRIEGAPVVRRDRPLLTQLLVHSTRGKRSRLCQQLPEQAILSR